MILGTSGVICGNLGTQKMRQKKEEKKLGLQLSSWQMFFLGGGKCPNLGVGNVGILGVVNVLLANDSQSCHHYELATYTEFTFLS